MLWSVFSQLTTGFCPTEAPTTRTHGDLVFQRTTLVSLQGLAANKCIVCTEYTLLKAAVVGRYCERAT